MKSTIILTLAAVAVVSLAGCNPVVSLRPLVVGDAATVTEPAMAGIWASADNKQHYLVIANDDKSYQMIFTEGTESQHFNMRLLRLDDQLIAEVMPANVPFGAIAGRFYYKVAVGNNQLQLATFDSDWLRHELKAGALDEETILAEPRDVRRYLKESRSFDEGDPLHRAN